MRSTSFATAQCYQSRLSLSAFRGDHPPVSDARVTGGQEVLLGPFSGICLILCWHLIYLITMVVPPIPPPLPLHPLPDFFLQGSPNLGAKGQPLHSFHPLWKGRTAGFDPGNVVRGSGFPQSSWQGPPRPFMDFWTQSL